MNILWQFFCHHGNGQPSKRKNVRKKTLYKLCDTDDKNIQQIPMFILFFLIRSTKWKRLEKQLVSVCCCDHLIWCYFFPQPNCLDSLNHLTFNVPYYFVPFKKNCIIYPLNLHSTWLCEPKLKSLVVSVYIITKP